MGVWYTCTCLGYESICDILPLVLGLYFKILPLLWELFLKILPWLLVLVLNSQRQICQTLHKSCPLDLLVPHFACLEQFRWVWRHASVIAHVILERLKLSRPMLSTYFKSYFFSWCLSLGLCHNGTYIIENL